jgi:hypothetical protein
MIVTVPRRLRRRAAALLTATVALVATGLSFAAPALAATPPTCSVSVITGGFSLSWSAATPDNGDAVDHYMINAYDQNTTANTTVNVSASTLSGTITGLVGGDPYGVYVWAYYTFANRQPSNATSFTLPAYAPATPAQPTVTVGPAVGQAVVTWVAPATNGSAITAYTIAGVDLSNSAGNVSSSVGNVTSATVTGLTTGDTYSFSVQATNGVGAGAASGSSSSVVAAYAPSAPTAPLATTGPGVGQAVVTWTAPAANGSGITGYTIAGTDHTNSAHNVSPSVGNVSSATVSGLTTGDTYSFTVQATNGLGTGAASGSSPSVVAPSLPGTPTGVTGVASSSSIQLSWVAPGSTGGSSITGYLISYTDVATSATLTQTSTGSGLTATVAGLLPAHSYTFTVATVTAIGTGTASTVTSAIAIPVAPVAPGVAGAVVVTAVPGGAHVSWTTPADTGGSPVTGFMVAYLDSTDGTGTVTHTVASGATTDAAVLHAGDHYAVTVRAVNALGNGPASASTTVIAFTTPGAPTGVSATARDGSAQVDWTAPADGFRPITGYSVSYADATDPGAGGSVTAAGSATSTLVTGLTDGDSYTFPVTATNSAGPGAASAASAAVTPQATVTPPPPPPPIPVVAVVGPVQAPTRVAVGGHGAGTVMVRFTLDRRLPVTVSLVAANGASIGSVRVNPRGTAVAAAVPVHLTRVAQLGHAHWVVRATGSPTVLLTRGVVLKQSSMLGMRATRSGGVVTVTGSAKWTSLAAGAVRGWAGERIQVQEQTAHGWKTVAVARTDALGHIGVAVTASPRSRLRLVDTASATVAADISAISTV